MKFKLFLETIWGKIISYQCVIGTLSMFQAFPIEIYKINGSLYLFSINTLPINANGRNCVAETMMHPRSPDKIAVSFNI